ncbi:MAG: DNA methyltransferase [Patescibacteria group bacterium]|nr:DNA methyltransferase [Patescibacteria group bacterium]
MKYFFILGNHPNISIAEIYSIFADDFEYDWVRRSVLLIETNKEINVKKIIAHLGGTIKIGEILDETKSRDRNHLLKLIAQIKQPKEERKFKFGFSYYGKKDIAQKALAMEYKKYLKEKNISCRWVNSKNSVLSSVVVEQNKLYKNGLEMVLIEDENKLLLGKTLAVQPFKDLSFHDYGRPARDNHSGMLPPKLAQIMVNLSSIKPANNIKILDPFCGSGTILMEAMLMGYPNLIGSDISQKAVEDTQKNLNWMGRKLRNSNYELKIKNCDAKQLSTFIPLNSVDAIITEPYLGPQRGKVDLNKVIPELEKLYSAVIKEFYQILKPSGLLVMIWPLIISGNRKRQVIPKYNNFKIIKVLENIKLQNKKFLEANNELIYGRKGQKVWRNLVVLEKI